MDIVIGVVGHKAGGKDTFAKLIIDKGFTQVRVSDLIRKSLAAETGELNAKTVVTQDYANRYRKEHGHAYWIERVIDEITKSGATKIIINGIRNPAEVESLQEAFGEKFVLVGITSPSLLRAKRFFARDPGDLSDMETFLAMDDRDRGVGEAAEGQHTERCIAMVPYTHVYNNIGTLEELSAWTDSLLGAFMV